MSIYKEYSIRDRTKGPHILETALGMFSEDVGKEAEVVLCLQEEAQYVEKQLEAILGKDQTRVRVIGRRCGRFGNVTLGVDYDEAEWPNNGIGTSGSVKATIDERKKEREMARKKEKLAGPKPIRTRAAKVEKEKVIKVKLPKLNRNPIGLCWCGCEGKTNVDSRFLPGHDGRLHGRLYKYEAGEPQKGGGELPENMDWLEKKVFPLLPKCEKCGNPYIEAKGKDGVGPYCLAVTGGKAKGKD